jgi:putative transposase
LKSPPSTKAGEIKQHLDIRNFLGSNDNAIRPQILAAMIAYLLLRIAARANHITMRPIRLAELVRHFRPIATIDEPPPINPSQRKSGNSLDQMEFCYA